MLELCAIASGSSGNCICVGSDNTHLLIDAGVSGKRIESGLNEIDLKTSEMQGILVTHEHIDHIAGLGVLARRHGIPIFATEKTIQAILNTKSVGKIDADLFQVVKPGRRFSIGELTINPISISHDAADPVAYKVMNGDKTVAGYYYFGCQVDECWDSIENNGAGTTNGSSYLAGNVVSGKWYEDM